VAELQSSKTTSKTGSKTALGVALLRAVHQLVDAYPKILEDTVAPSLFEADFLSQIQTDTSRFQTLAAIALRSHVVLRSRYAEDQLAEAVKNGIRQYIILGAGFDTFAYRQPQWAHELRIFEIDHPASQQEKRERLDQAGIQIPSNLEFVPIDFETTTLEGGLAASSFDPTLPTFIACLGVLVYISQEAATAIFRFVQTLPPVSQIVFTFTQPLPDKDGPRAILAKRAAELGEPWRTFITLSELTTYLSGLGFTKINLPLPAELRARYIGERTDGLYASEQQSLATVIVTN
jgi:methyltransferase (TIGR00027 family)